MTTRAVLKRAGLRRTNRKLWFEAFFYSKTRCSLNTLLKRKLHQHSLYFSDHGQYIVWASWRFCNSHSILDFVSFAHWGACVWMKDDFITRTRLKWPLFFFCENMGLVGVPILAGSKTWFRSLLDLLLKFFLTMNSISEDQSELWSSISSVVTIFFFFYYSFKYHLQMRKCNVSCRTVLKISQFITSFWNKYSTRKDNITRKCSNGVGSV